MMVVDGAMSGVARWDSSPCLNSVFVDVLSINSSCSPCSHSPSLWTESPSETTHQYSGVPTANDILTAENQIPRVTIESERKKQILHIYIHLSNPPTGHRHLWMCVCACVCVDKEKQINTRLSFLGRERKREPAHVGEKFFFHYIYSFIFPLPFCFPSVCFFVSFCWGWWERKGVKERKKRECSHAACSQLHVTVQYAR